MTIKVVIIDNYDSFVYNLADMLGALGAQVVVLRNNVGLAAITELEPTHLVISPGPGRPPDDTGVCCEAILYFADKIPILGVCLGHQAIGYAFGAKIVPAKKIMHGKTSQIFHRNVWFLEGVDERLTIGRYHSLVIDPESLPDCLTIAASDDKGDIMAIASTGMSGICGLQFHPESILTADDPTRIMEGQGARILANFLGLGR